MAGYAVFSAFAGAGRGLPRWASTAALIALVPYVVFLNYLLNPDNQSPLRDHRAILSSVSFLPFYYYYFSADPAALASFANYLKMYLAVGALIWVIRNGRERVLMSAALAAALVGYVPRLTCLRVRPSCTRACQRPEASCRTLPLERRRRRSLEPIVDPRGRGRVSDPDG